jgi:hypothetical protein
MIKLNAKDKIFYYAVIMLLFIIICMMAFFIYIIINKRYEIHHHVYTENVKVLNQADNIPVYPKNLPQYDSNEFQQIGLLTANESDKEPIILPLFAKKLVNNKDRWQYYTATDKNNMMRLPIVHYNMKCDEDIGCKEIYDGDTLSIEIYQGRIFTATIYKKDSPKYFADVY